MALYEGLQRAMAVGVQAAGGMQQCRLYARQATVETCLRCCCCLGAAQMSSSMDSLPEVVSCSLSARSFTQSCLPDLQGAEVG